jgi:hypothetical protein
LTRSMGVGKVKMMNYEDIVEAEGKLDAREAAVAEGKSKRRSVKFLYQGKYWRRRHGRVT